MPGRGGPSFARTLTGKQSGLYQKYDVRRRGGDKPGSRYFVLDYGRDPLAKLALRAYAFFARAAGHTALAHDLDRELR